MRVFDKTVFFVFAVFLFLACSDDPKKVASGYTEEQNAGLDSALVERLKTWEPEVPVDSTKHTVKVESKTYSWYEIDFSTDAETYYECGDAESVVCSVNIYEQENGVRLNMAWPSMTYIYTEVLMRDSAKAVVVDRLDNTYANEDASALCRRDSVEFVGECEDDDGTIEDMLGSASCSELHLACTRKFTPNVKAGMYLKNTAAELQKRGEDKASSEPDGGEGDEGGSGNKTAESDTILTDARDGQTYKTTVVNGQRWMAENLRYDAGDASACYDDDESNCEKYGRLYTWDSLLCPTGWRLPSLEEYRALEELAEEDISRLKSTSDWENPGTDEYGLNFLPGGMCKSQGDSVYHGMGQGACLWTGDYMGMAIAVDIDSMGDLWMDSGSSLHYVRCVED